MLVAAAVAAALSVLAPGASAPALAAPQATPMSRPASSGMTSYEPPAIVIIAIPDLRWTDLAAMPRLRAFARSSAVGNLSVKTPGSRAGCADGLLTFGAGNRVSAGVNGCTVTPGDFLAAEHAAETGPFGANVGAFGEALHTAQLGAQALDPFAFPMVARPEDARTSVPAEQSDGHLPVVSAAVDVDLYRVRPGRRAAAALQLDRKITGQLAEAPGASYLVIAGISDGATGSSHLHPLLISHPGWHNVELARPGSRPPYVELIDLAPTILHWLGRAPPDSMAGRVWR